MSVVNAVRLESEHGHARAERPTAPAEAPGSDGGVVDVGIPTLGTSPYLAESIESVLAQTLPSWRLVVSENGPGTEHVRRVLEPYLGDPRIRHVVTGKKLRIGPNHTNVLRAGSAPYVGILHDDDRWHPGFLERRVEFLEQHPTCGYVYSGQVIIDEEGKALGRKKLKPGPGVHRPEDFLPRLYRDNFVGVPTVLVRRSAYEAVGAEYKDILLCDIEMWLRLAARFDVGCLAVWDAEYRIHPAQVSASRTRLAEAQFAALDAMAELPIPPPLRRLVRAEAHMRSALDAIERGERRRAGAHLVRAVKVDPTSLLRPSVVARMVAGSAALAAGGVGRRALTSVRERRWRSGGADGLLDLREDRRLPRPPPGPGHASVAATKKR